VPELRFQIVGNEAVAHSAAPLLALKLRITNKPLDEIHTISLRCQVQIEPTKRRYLPEEQDKLHDLFGEPSRWGKTVRPLLWMNTSLSVPEFSESIVIDLPLPCSYDFNVATTKYFYALAAGEIPLCVMFSGTVFYKDESGLLQATQIPWDREAYCRLPVQVWRDMMAMHYANHAWLSLRQDAFDRLYEYKMQNGIPTWEQAIERLLPQSSKKTETLAEAAEVKA
jgi:hypothetical protein